ncbi:MAG TPA: 4Fe-4S dicluster domain-containing protein [Gemmatales bacterium]|nr:4Fe-4S dicluster domain-containing protein [Gemmatales bacterium]
MEASENQTPAYYLTKAEFPSLLTELRNAGYTIIGPTIQQNAIVYDEIQQVEQLPIGWTEIQEPGKYRLEPRNDQAYFGYVVGPHSWKKYLFPAQLKVGEAQRVELGWKFSTPTPKVRKLAFLGVRACELAALEVQDRVFLGGPYVDRFYQLQRDELLLVAVNCTQAAPTCFCTSMNTGPRCKTGFDIGLTELAEGFLLEAGNARGVSWIQQLPTRPATHEQRSQGEVVRRQAEEQISKTMSADGIRDLLLTQLEHPQWQDVAERCLSCANCTMVCPTCFCSTVTEVADLLENQVDRVRHWDSCFNYDFSYTNTGTARPAIRDRYRQWMTHKLASWHDQFGMSGCVGCGRCITWCPVGIDITEEVAAIRRDPLASAPGGSS